MCLKDCVCFQGEFFLEKDCIVDDDDIFIGTATTVVLISSARKVRRARDKDGRGRKERRREELYIEDGVISRTSPAVFDQHD